MPVWSVLLRLLLSLSLALNGVTAAAATTHLPMAQDAMRSAPATHHTMTAGAMPCHGHHGMASAMPAGDHASTMHASTPAAPKHASPDCCKSGTCRCACVHAAPATLPIMLVATLLVEHDRSARPLSLGHAAPALPHLIRPPIG